MQTVELMLRINIQVPDKIEIIRDLIVDFDSKDNKIFGMDILDADSCPIDYVLNEYETLDVIGP